jgi:iron(III) transport system permease protein
VKSFRPPLFLTLAAGVVTIAIAIPLVYLTMRTLGMGGDRLWELVTRDRTIEVLVNSVAVAATVTFFSLLIAIPLAFLTVRTDLPWRKFWSIATTLPLAIPSYIGSFALIATFAPKGSFVQILLEPWGVEELPSIYGFWGTVVAITLFTYPYLLLSVRSGLQGIDPALEEAARSLGCNRQATFVRVLLPQLQPSIVAGSLLVALYSIRDFGTPSLMQFDTFTRAIFTQYKSSFDRNSAAALSLMLVLLVSVVLLLEYRVRSRAAYYSRGSASLRSPQITKLGVWKFPAIIFCAIVTGLGVVLPVGITAFWLFYDFAPDYDFANLLTAGTNSLLVAGLAAAVTIFFALPVSILAVRFPSKITATIERASYLSFGIPGIAIALSLVFFGANYAPWLYQTLPMLIFAYLILFLPQSIGTVRSALLQVHPHLEESARSLGKNPRQTIWQVVVPLVRNGILSGAILVFLTAIKELPATMLLAPIEFDTLATQIWQATENVSFGDAAWAALLLLLISMGATLSILSYENIKQPISKEIGLITPKKISG